MTGKENPLALARAASEMRAPSASRALLAVRGVSASPETQTRPLADRSRCRPRCRPSVTLHTWRESVKTGQIRAVVRSYFVLPVEEETGKKKRQRSTAGKLIVATSMMEEEGCLTHHEDAGESSGRSCAGRPRFILPR